MRFRSSLLLPFAALLGGCVLADSTQPTVPSEVKFAPSLEVDLSAMTRIHENLYFKDIIVGTGATAQQFKLVIVSYSGYLSDGTQFDARTLPETSLDESHLITGWVYGIPGMKVGGKRKLVIGSSWAYGPAGSPPAIPAHATLVFDVELKSVR